MFFAAANQSDGIAIYFFGPLIMSMIAAVYMWIDEWDLWKRLIVAAVVIASAVLQFLPGIASSQYVYIPVFIQVGVCLYWFFARQFQ